MRDDDYADRIIANPASLSLLVGSNEPAVSDDVGHQDRDKLAGLALRTFIPAVRQTFKQGRRLSDFRHFRRWRKTFKRWR